MSDTTCDDIVAALTEVGDRTFALLDPITDTDQTRQVSPLMSPLVWDLAHMANYEELWLVSRIAGTPTRAAALDDMYNAFEHPRWERPSLPLLGPTAARAYYEDVRAESIRLLEKLGLDDSDPLTRDGFVYAMVVMHHHQHCETMLATLGLMGALPAGSGPLPVAPGAEVHVPAGAFTAGTDRHAWAYDDEKPAHDVEVDAFWIDTAPVTNSEFRCFVDDGAYTRPGLWSTAGARWLAEEAATGPLVWHDELDPAAPVQHVSWYEADAYARWAGRHLPTEMEWEKARRSDVLGGTTQVWEWTSTTFAAYPGYRAFPYAEYSEVFFGEGYKVLRGGSWATHPLAVSATFRNWDWPQRRQIFSGFRTVRREG
ncbi:MAG: SUMF1/EgtB/PvdO family nonheme iron enzyme [Acidimicrobiia bacterium]|nr:SUMF1/EgtB/PvdO family nonheme iron enzyme [Acidimicrobiia bacterium]